MTNLIELIRNQDYKTFTEEATKILDESAVQVFNEFREIQLGISEGHSQGHMDMVDLATGKLKVFKADGSEDTESDIPAKLDAQLNTEDVSLEDVIGILLDEGVLTEEDLDTVTEEDILELSKKTLGSYIKKAKDDYARAHRMAAVIHNYAPEREINDRIKNKRSEGIDKAVDRLTKEAIVQDYNKTAPLDSTGAAVIAGNPKPEKGEDHNKEFMDMLDNDKVAKIARAGRNRVNGLKLAGQKIAKEEVEQVEEISTTKLAQYIKKAAPEASYTSYETGKAIQSKRTSAFHANQARKADNRTTGISKAADRIIKRNKD